MTDLDAVNARLAAFEEFAYSIRDWLAPRLENKLATIKKPEPAANAPATPPRPESNLKNVLESLRTKAAADTPAPKARNVYTVQLDKAVKVGGISPHFGRETSHLYVTATSFENALAAVRKLYPDVQVRNVSYVNYSGVPVIPGD